MADIPLPDGYRFSFRDQINDWYWVEEIATGVLIRLTYLDVMELTSYRLPERFRAVANPYERMTEDFA